MPAREESWLDDEAGPVVRPYALTQGRTRPRGRSLDLVTMVTAVRRGRPSASGLEPEHLELLRRCRRPASVADLAADLGLPLGVIQVLLADLVERSLIVTHHPVPPARLPEFHILQEVADALHRL